MESGFIPCHQIETELLVAHRALKRAGEFPVVPLGDNLAVERPIIGAPLCAMLLVILSHVYLHPHTEFQALATASVTGFGSIAV